MPWTFIRDDITIPEYFALLSVALGKEEEDRYMHALLTAIAFNDPKQVKKLKPKKVDVLKGDGFKTIAEFALKQTGGNLGGPGDPTAFAKATGRSIIYILDDGRFVNETGEFVERGLRDIVLPISRKAV